MVPQKGPDVLVRACLKLDPALDFELVMVGSPGFSADAALTPYEQRLREFAAPLGDRVSFQPFQPRSAIPELLRTADVMVVPSQWPDPCPLAVLEGWATGLAIVATAVGGSPEVLGDGGQLVPRNAVRPLTEALSRLLGDDAHRRDWATRGRARAGHLTWAHTETALEKLLGSSPSH